MHVRRLPRDHPRVVDVVIAGGCLLILILAVITDDGYLSGPRWAYLTASFLMTVPLAWRRSAPLTSLVMVMTGLGVQELLVDPAPTMDDALIPLLISAFSVAAHGTRTTAGLGLGVSYVLSGEGEVWRRAKDGHESITRLVAGVCIDIPLGTAFQYRCTGGEPLVFTCTALPPWPGDDEALIIEGPWAPSVDPEPDAQRSERPQA